MVDGTLRKGDKIQFMASGMEYDALNIGTLVPGGEVEGTELRAGEVRRLSPSPSPGPKPKPNPTPNPDPKPNPGPKPTPGPKPNPKPTPNSARWAFYTARSRASTTHAWEIRP